MASTISAGTTSGTAIVVAGDTTGNLAFQTNGTTTAMTIDTSQNVGIGTSSPAALLSFGSLASGSSDGARIYLRNNTNEFAIGTNGFQSVYAGYEGHVWQTGSFGGTERMRIDSSGNLLVGTTGGQSSRIVTQADGTSIYGLTSNMTAASGTRYHCIFRESNTERGSITSNGSATAYNTSSDYRLKENIAPMTGALAKITQLKPCTYTWKVNGSIGQGFIAHELQAIVPDAVTGEKDAIDEEGNAKYQGVDTSFLVATLTAAIQELKAIVDTQATKIAELEAKLEGTE
jgi:hypothetical protein